MTINTASVQHTATGLGTTNESQVNQSAKHVKLTKILELVGDLLPAQGPISAFVFLNTLQGLEDLPFDVGVQRGGRLFGAQAYMSEDFYRTKLEQERILPRDLEAVLREDLGETVDGSFGEFGTRHDIRLAMLRHPLRHGPAEELRWFVAETDALTRMPSHLDPAQSERFIKETRHWVMRDVRNGSNETAARKHGPRGLLGNLLKHYGEDSIENWPQENWEALSLQALWRVCREGVHGLESRDHVESGPIRHRDLLLEAGGEDADLPVHDTLIRFCASYADQGFASWRLPHRDEGFFRSFCQVYARGAPPDRRLQKLPDELARVQASGLSPLDLVIESLDLLGVTPGEWEDYVAATMLALRGWAGLLHQMEVRPDRVPLAAPEGTTLEFLAVRLLLDRVALAEIAERTLGYVGPLDELRSASLEKIVGRPAANVEQRAFLMFQVAQAMGWLPAKLYALSKAEWAALVHEAESFDEMERRRVLHQAFERRYREQALDAFSVMGRKRPQRVVSPRFQISFCIDAREESFRRHLEEVAPDVETFAAPGFYCIPIYFRGVADAHFSTLCPIVVRPQHWVVEEVVYTLGEEHRRRAKTRKAIGAASRRVHVGSRGMASGALLTAGFGVLASIPLVARVLFPGLTAAVRRHAGKFVDPPPVTRLVMERTAEKPSAADDGIGFTVAEMANFGERVLRDIGLTDGFARLVIFLGHGSYCINNPHKAAYDCGACSGAAGGPNARALAAMLNDPRVRQTIALRGLPIPVDTYFVGGQHNTTTDEIEFFDLDLLPKSHHKDLESARNTLLETCTRNAHERCRRFYSVPLNVSPTTAHRLAAERSEDLAQTRPEFGNASNAIAFVGRRSRVRGLFMDRRAFMHSYDPDQDDADATILNRILGPVVVVCSGINLQYYFSHVDSPGWGSGTKLPHNVTSLLGVMDGHSSDLRCGLPWQGVEIHEPMRCLFIFETRPEAMYKIMARNPLVKRVLVNGWGQLALLDPDSPQIQLFHNGEFRPYQPTHTELPVAPSSIEWYRGWRDHLGFAHIVPS